MKIVWFDQDVESRRIGGKGFRLCRLAQAGFPVPPGFCVPVEDMNDVTAGDIECALQRLAVKAVAVRSSAVEEDTAAASFAGVYLTRLNVNTPQAVLDALKDIRESAFSPAAQAYRQKRGIDGVPQMAAVIQQFLMPDVSGVLFLRDPLDNSERIIIEGSWGLGESVVAGTVTPDRWVLSHEGTILTSEISDKDVAVVAADTGTKTTEVDPGRRKIPCIDHGAIRELVDLARACEDLFGSPQDIEWAIASNRIWLLQSRPITCRAHIKNSRVR
jgi:pyruvate,water dikinase